MPCSSLNSIISTTVSSGSKYEVKHCNRALFLVKATGELILVSTYCAVAKKEIISDIKHLKYCLEKRCTLCTVNIFQYW